MGVGFRRLGFRVSGLGFLVQGLSLSAFGVQVSVWGSGSDFRILQDLIS